MNFIALIHSGRTPVQAGTLLAADDMVHIPYGNAVLTGKPEFIFYYQRGAGVNNLPFSAVPHIGSRRGGHQKNDIGAGCFQGIRQVFHGFGMLGGIVATPVGFVGTE